MSVKIGVTVMPVRDHGSVLNSQEQPLRVACTSVPCITRLQRKELKQSVLAFLV
jgi:hypothetical protein